MSYLRTSEVCSVIISGIPTLFASSTSQTHPTPVAGNLCQIAALRIYKVVRLQIFTNTFKDGNGGIGRTIVVTPQHDAVVGIRAHHSYGLTRIERQERCLLAIGRTVVFKQHDALASSLQTLGLMLCTCNDRRRNCIVRGFIVHLSQLKTSLEQTEH